MGALSFAFFDPEEAREWVDDYYTTLEHEAVPIGDAVNPNIACVTTFFCHEDSEEAVRRGAFGANFIGYSLGHYYVYGRHQPAMTDLWADYKRRRKEKGYDPEAVQLAASNPDQLGAKVVEEGVTGLRGAMGTPEQVRDYIRRYEDCGVDQLILSCTSGKNKHEHIMECLELFGREVMPEFNEREEERQRKKDERLAPVIEKIMARKPARDHPPLSNPDYAITAGPRMQADQGGSEKFHNWLDNYADRIAGGEDVSKRLR
jgi:hypothetical protein